MNKNITLEDLGYKMYDGRKGRIYPFILYKKEENNIEYSIDFDLTDETIEPSAIENFPKTINMQELQAIYNKCKELGWFDEQK